MADDKVFAAYDGPPEEVAMKMKVATPAHAAEPVNAAAPVSDFSFALPSQEAIDSVSPGLLRVAAKFHVQTAVSLVITLLAAISTVGHFDHATAVPVIIALSTALLTWLTPRVTSGVLAYSKLAVAILGAVAQIVVPVAFTGGWSTSLLPIVAVAVYGAFQTWLVPDAKSVVRGPVRTV